MFLLNTFSYIFKHFLISIFANLITNYNTKLNISYFANSKQCDLFLATCLNILKYMILT